MARGILCAEGSDASKNNVSRAKGNHSVSLETPLRIVLSAPYSHNSIQNM